jgi:hypothetical protein
MPFRRERFFVEPHYSMVPSMLFFSSGKYAFATVFEKHLKIFCRMPPRCFQDLRFRFEENSSG